MADYREICEQYSCGRLVQWRSITQNKISIIKSNFGINDDQITAFYDSSAFENSKVGLAICDSGIYYRNSFQSPYYLTWKQVRSLKFTYDSDHLKFGDNSVFIFAADVDKMAQMIFNIRVNVKIENFVEKTTGFLGFLESASNWLSELDTSNPKLEDQTLSISDTPSSQANNVKTIEIPQTVQQSDGRRWTIGFKSKTYGPYATDEVKNWINQNYDGSDKLFGFKKGMANWELMSTLQEFSHFMNELNFLPPLPES